MSSLFHARSGALSAARRHLRQLLLMIAGGLFAAPFTVFAAESPLSLTETLNVAVLRSRQLMAADAALVATEQMAIAAGQLPDPVLTLGLDSWPVDGRHQFSVGRDDFTMGRIAISQEVTRSDKRQLRAQHYTREGARAAADKAVLTAVIERNVALVWLERFFTEAMASLLADQIDTATSELTLADAAYRGGHGNLADVLTTRAVIAELQDRASEIDQRVVLAKTALTRWIGDAAARPLATKPAFDLAGLDLDHLDTDLAHHPEITVLDRREELAETDARLAEANRQADWSIALGYAQRGAGLSDFVSLSVSIPLQWDQANRQDREVAAKHALVEQIDAEREEALRREVGIVRARVLAWQRGRQRLERYDHELIPLAQARVDATAAAYASGKGSATEVMRARRDELDVRLRALDLELKTARSWAQLTFLLRADDTPRYSHFGSSATAVEGVTP